MQCVILAGGLATRMRPLTASIPKVLVPVAGRPFLDYQLEWLARVGVSKVLLSVGFLGEQVYAYVSAADRHGLVIDIADEGTELRGTAGALRLAMDKGLLDPAFLVTYGDSFLPIDFTSVWRAFEASGKPALMTVFHNAGRWDQSNVVVEGERVLYDKQRRARPEAAFTHIDYGLSALARSVVATRVPAHVPGQGRADLATLFHELSLEGLLAAHEVQQRFYEIGSPSGLMDFERWISSRA